MIDLSTAAGVVAEKHRKPEWSRRRWIRRGAMAALAYMLVYLVSVDSSPLFSGAGLPAGTGRRILDPLWLAPALMMVVAAAVAPRPRWRSEIRRSLIVSMSPLVIPVFGVALATALGRIVASEVAELILIVVLFVMIFEAVPVVAQVVVGSLASSRARSERYRAAQIVLWAGASIIGIVCAIAGLAYGFEPIMLVPFLGGTLTSWCLYCGPALGDPGPGGPEPKVERSPAAVGRLVAANSVVILLALAVLNLPQAATYAPEPTPPSAGQLRRERLCAGIEESCDDFHRTWSRVLNDRSLTTRLELEGDAQFPSFRYEFSRDPDGALRNTSTGNITDEDAERFARILEQHFEFTVNQRATAPWERVDAPGDRIRYRGWCDDFKSDPLSGSFECTVTFAFREEAELTHIDVTMVGRFTTSDKD